MKKIWFIIFLLIVAATAAGIYGGYLWGYKSEQVILNKKLSSIKPIRANDPNYKFINPLLLYLIPSSDQEDNLVSLQNKIKKIISDDKQQGLDDASVYFSDLNHGRWIGVGQNDQYNPASMLKVVIMVACLKQSESDPEFLDKYFVYTKSIDSTVHQDQFNTLSELSVGNSYKVSDLINKMIIDSDNGAAELLLNNIKQTSVDSIFSELNLGNPDVSGSGYTISPRAYSYFFRILYSSTYLNDSNSEKALNILSQAIFKDGISSGVPDNVSVAHKYGEHVILGQNSQLQKVELHDCGIVYYPKNPYLLCVMTRGTNLDNLESIIKDISSTVYQTYISLR